MSAGAKFKGYIKNNVSGEIKPFMYNPTTFQYSRGSTYSDIDAPGSEYPGTQFVKGNARSFNVELFVFDNPSTGKIKEYMLFFGAFLTEEKNASWHPKKPPDFTFCFGTFVRRCVLENLDILNELYDSEGNPVQTRFTLQIRQVSP